MQQPREFRAKALKGLEAGRNPSYLASVYLGFERGIWRAPTGFLGFFWGPLTAIAASSVILLCAILFLVIGFPVWVATQLAIFVMGFTGHLRPRRSSLVRNNQSVVS